MLIPCEMINSDVQKNMHFFIFSMVLSNFSSLSTPQMKYFFLEVN